VKRPSLRTVLLFVNRTVLLLPLGGIWSLRVYESALVRETESALIAQAAFIAASYRNNLLTAIDRQRTRLSLADVGIDFASTSQAQAPDSRPWAFRSAQLDLATDVVLPRPPDGVRRERRANALAIAVGTRLTKILNEAQRTTLAAMRVVDPHGTVIGSTGEDTGLSLAHLQEIERALNGEMVSTLRRRISDEPTPPLSSMSRGANVRVFVTMPIVHDRHLLGAVMLSRTPLDISKAIYAQRGLLLTSALALLAIVFAMSLFTSITIRRPIAALIEQSGRAIRGERGAVIPLSKPVTADIAVLSEALAKMANTLEERANAIQRSVHHISHEFKTPLTSMLGSIELMRDHGDSTSTEQRLRFLNNLEDDLKRLEHLLRSYLDLAKAEAILDPSGSSELMTSIESCLQRYRARGLSIEFTPSPTPVVVAMDEETLGTVISNLLENVVHHAGSDREVRITAESLRRDGGDYVRITIADNGAGVSFGNRENIFQPFFTTARANGGTCLGLALVQSLLKAYRGTIELVPSEQGATFDVFIPVAELGAT
jgi:signal transduction histidine kinase